jgi:hypothetical protein
MTVYCEGKLAKEEKGKEAAKEKEDGVEGGEKEEETFADKAPREGSDVWGRSRKFEKQEKQE